MEDKTQELVAKKSGKRVRNWLIAGTVAAVSAMAVVGAVSAQGGPGFGFGPGSHFAGHGLDRALDAVDASKEQEEHIWAIIDGARAAIRPTFREFRDTPETLSGLLGAATIDRAAVEKLRAQQIASMDDASKIATEAALDAAEVLTPEQRAKLAKHFEERRSGRW